VVKRPEHLWSLVNGKWVIVLTILFLGAVYSIKSDRYFGWRHAEHRIGEPIMSDGAGYYAYLPQWFVYGTSNFEFLDTIRKTYGSSRFTDNIYETDPRKKHSDKYYIGTAVSMTPFFGAAHAYAHMTDYPEDGYSKPYQFMTNVASIAYFLFGCIGLVLFLRRFDIDRFWIAGILMAIGFGTNISFFCNVQVPFSHPFCFAIVSWLLLYAKKWADEHTAKHFILLCLFIGWGAIIRPTNVLVVAFIPFLFPSTADFLQRLRQLFTAHRKSVIFGLLTFCILVFFQLWSTHVQTGRWALNTYTTESFDNWSSPKIPEVLFSWRKGLFVFAPVLLLLFPGWIVLFRRNRRLFWGSVLFFALFTYVTASWWCWWYGGGLGMRNYIDVLPLLALPIAFLLQYARIWLQVLLTGFMIFTAWMYQVYEFQMKQNILHYDDMTYEQFSHVFMKQDLRYRWALHLVYEKLPQKQPVQTRHPRFRMKGRPLDVHKELTLHGSGFTENPVVSLVSDSTLRDRQFGARITGKVRIPSGETNPAFIALYFVNGKVYRENHFFVGQFIEEVGKLTPVTVDLFPGQTYAQFDSVQVLFDDGSWPVGIRDFKIEERIYAR
jgi:hypothetical protein